MEKFKRFHKESRKENESRIAKSAGGIGNLTKGKHDSVAEFNEMHCTILPRYLIPKYSFARSTLH